MLPAMSSTGNAIVSGSEASDAAAEARFAGALAALRTRRPLRHPALRDARQALDRNRPDLAALMLNPFREKHRNDVDAMNLLAETWLCQERKREAEMLLAQCVERAPGFDAARFNYANALQQMNKPGPALEQVETLLTKDPRNPLYRDMKAVLLAALGNQEDSLACRRELAKDYPGSAKVLVSYAQTLRTLGRRDESIAAFREAIAISPALGTAWWGLANLRTYRFTAQEVDRLRLQLARSDISTADRTHLLFALGKAYGDFGLYAESFDAYARANAARRVGSRYDPATTTAQVEQFKALITPEFFATRAQNGCRSDAPIFVVGMQRAGSTLVEQILASHSSVEGAGELAHLRFLARELEDLVAPQYGCGYPGVLSHLQAPELMALGERYLEETRSRRRSGRPFFVDKEPFNFWHIPMLQLILPNARIVDVRRHPLGCCWSNFATIFLHGLPLTYRLGDIGRYYADYVEVMAHFDRALPGKVHRIFYENLVADPEFEIRRLLDRLDLPFEEACLKFHSNARALNSASSEQVRTPIFDDALDWWRHYESWLGPLKTALGPVLDTYPAVPG